MNNTNSNSSFPANLFFNPATAKRRESVEPAPAAPLVKGEPQPLASIGYREDPDFLFSQRIRVKKGQERVTVRAYRVPGHEGAVTAEVRLGSLVVFSRGFLVVQVPDGVDPKVAVLDMLAAETKNAPVGFFERMGLIQRAVWQEMHPAVVRARLTRFPSVPE
jgi:hypothetical protein